MYNQVNNADARYVVRSQLLPEPDVSKLPSFPCRVGDASTTCQPADEYQYTAIDRMTVRDATPKSGMCAFQCIQPNWCNAKSNSYEPPADASGGAEAIWRGAWKQLATTQCPLTSATNSK